MSVPPNALPDPPRARSAWSCLATCAYVAELLEQALRHVASHKRSPVIEPIAGLQLVQQHAASSPEPALYEPVLCLILQGRKQVSFRDQTLSFGPGECLLVTHDLPVHSSVTKAPYLALIFDVDIAAVRKLYDEVADLETTRARALETHRASPALLDALCRYLALADAPADAKVLGPLTSREILNRLLMAPFGGMLRQLVWRRHGRHNRDGVDDRFYADRDGRSERE